VTAARRLGTNDAAALRAIRLEALTLFPDCFCADLELTEAWTPEQWVESLARVPWFGVEKDGELVGIAALMRPASKKIRHTGELMSMYVRTAEQGTGLAAALLDAVLRFAAEDGQDQVKLTVSADNARAIRFYERHEFRVVGRVPNYIRIGDVLHDELVMIRHVSQSD
jgi:ribosomal protein S18 acetylase RimI-like enzyme